MELRTEIQLQGSHGINELNTMPASEPVITVTS